ncbi:unnamed protein product [Somion occarium]
MTSPLDKLDALEKELSRLSTAEDKLNSVTAYLRDTRDSSRRIIHDIRTETSETDDEAKTGKRLTMLMRQHGLLEAYAELQIPKMLSEAVKPLENVLCANVDITNGRICQEEGKQACGGCKLVLYCSKTQHWRLHKNDCKDPIRSPNWKPAWIVEKRSPTFMSGNNTLNERWQNDVDRIALTRAHLWGNIPAYDVLALARNETVLGKDYNVAFVASGDLRNVVFTVNGLPEEFSGRLTIILNDRDSHVTLRNILLLSLLGLPDVNSAAELALHAWYSVFLPMEYAAQVSHAGFRALQDLKVDGSIHMQLSPTSTLAGQVSDDIRSHFLACLDDTSFGMGEAAREYERVRFAPSRVDRHHRWYGRLEPSHRLACLEYRRFGLVLPFGAKNDHFNMPNRTLFSSDGCWLQNDLANPLDGWNAKSIVEAGRKHGASRADLYGCLYFFLSEQLRVFARRLRKFRISFHIFNRDASDLSKAIRAGNLASYGVPSTIRFDRVDVSNIMDAEYVGIPRIVTFWGPLLATGQHATLLGYFMNWVNRQKGGNINSLDPKASEYSGMMEGLEDEGKIPRLTNRSLATAQEYAGMIGVYMGFLMTKYDNSKAFQTYLDKHGMAEVLQKAQLKLRQRHTILPNRIGSRVGGAPSDLPEFPDSESWYFDACVDQQLWSERFIETVWA